jgi:phasin family protein
MEPQPSPASVTGEIARIVGQLRLPGLSVPAIIEARRRDIEALVEANRIVLAGAEELAAKQRQILQQAVEELQSLVLERKAPQSADEPPRQLGELVHKALQSTFGNMRDLAEITRKSQSDAFDVVSERMRQDMDELRTMLLPARS